MHVDRFLVNLFFEIRQRLPVEERVDMKLSAADLGDRLTRLHESTEDAKVRALIEVFVERSGENWLAKAKPVKNRYRGVEVESKKVAPSTNPKTSKSKGKAKKKPRYYRGALIE